MQPSHKKKSTKHSLILAMSDALRAKGYHAHGVNEILKMADAPKGVLYHHFPGGKAQLAQEAVRFSTAMVIEQLESLRAAKGSSLQALESWLQAAEKQLKKDNYSKGCPLAAMSIEVSQDESEELRKQISLGFEQIRKALIAILADTNLPDAEIKSLSTLVIASYEGALLQARAARKTEPLKEVTHMLIKITRVYLERTMK